MALFENYERRIDKINGVLAQYGISSVEECRELCQSKGFDPYEIVKGIQPICFENACWAYTVGAAIALKSGVKTAAEAAKMIGVGLQSFCIDGSVAEADLAVVGDGAGDAEALQADADGLGSFGSGLHALADGDRRADAVRPAGVLEGDGLHALDDLIGIKALFLADSAALLNGVDAVLGEDGVDLVDSSFVAFKQCHFLSSSYSCRGSMYLAAFSNWP